MWSPSHDRGGEPLTRSVPTGNLRGTENTPQSRHSLYGLRHDGGRRRDGPNASLTVCSVFSYNSDPIIETRASSQSAGGDGER